MNIQFLKIKIVLSLLFFVLIFSLSSTVYAMPNGFQLETVISGFNLPTNAQYAPDGRIFVAEKGGLVKVVKNGMILPTPFYQLTSVNTYGDNGLIGMVLDPNFSSNGYVYLSYVHDSTPGLDNQGPKMGRVIRITANGDVAVSGSEVVLVGTEVGDALHPSCSDFPVGTDCIASDHSTHTVNSLVFGLDGKLYVSIGDGSDFNGADPLALRAQNIDLLNGKVLRINPDGTAPTDNPFFNGDPNANRSKVWYYGLRNPFRININPANGKLYVGEVGWFSYEEINVGDPGSNFGWPCREGTIATPSYNCSVASTTDPIYSYPHDPMSGAGSVTGGIFYTGNNYPASYKGQYFFGDYAQDWIRTLLENATSTPIATDFLISAGGPVNFFAGPNGDINYISIYTGSINKITYTSGNRTPTAMYTTSSVSGLAPLLINFDATGSSDPDNDSLTFAWDFGDGATSTSTTTSHTYTVNGVYFPTLTVTDIYGATSTVQTRIIVGNMAPSATIVNPANNSLYIGGQYIPLVGSATDLEDGVLPESAYVWRIILHHNIHTHVIDQKIGSQVTILTESHGDPSEDVFIETELTVTDSVGLSTTTSIFLRQAPPSAFQPYLSNVVLSNSSPIINSTLTITANVGNLGTSVDPILVDLELYNSSGTRVAQSFYDNQYISSSTIQSFLLNWTPTVAGDYHLAVGLIRPNWNGLYEWIPNAVTFTVNASTTNATSTMLLGGALDFDGADDYIDTQNWDIEENVGFTLEARFQADSITKEMHLISKEGILPNESLWMLGVADNATGPDTLRFQLNTNGIVTVLDGGSVAPNEMIHASAVFDGNNMLLYKNGMLVASTAKAGPLITNPVGMVRLGDNPASFTLNAFDGKIDEIRVWNLPRTSNDILSNSNKELDLSLNNYGLIKYWEMDEGFGQDIIDSSNSGHHGTLGSTSSVDVNDPSRVGTGFASPGGVFAPTHTLLVNSTQTVVGAPITFTETITNNGDGAGYAIVDIEIYDQNNNRVFQKYYDGAGFLPGASRDFTFTWTPASTGNFRIAVGLIRLHWLGAYEWINQVSMLNVTSAPIIDNINPISTITSPLNGTTISGTTTITVEATDNISVAGVTLLLDGVILGPEDTSSPYSFVWNTASTTNALHTLVARARDASGNTGTSTPIAVTVDNSIVTTGPFAPSQIALSVAPEQANTGTPVRIITTINNSGIAGSALIDLEVYQNGVKIDQRFFDNEYFAEGETRTFTWDWIPSVVGRYGLAIGILKPSWAGLYEWNSPPNLITVSNVLATTTPPVQVYSDNTLETGWSNWSWDTVTNLINPTSYVGSTSLSVNFTGIWGGLYLRHNSITMSNTMSLKFAISGAVAGNQKLQVLALDANGLTRPRVLLSSYINPLLPNGWQQVSIPLSDLGIGNGEGVTGFIIQGSSGLIEPEFYIDNIRFE